MGEKFTVGHLVYELTEACNQNCRFCYNHWRPDGCTPPDARLAEKTLKLILKQSRVGNISFSGGEPTLLKNIHDLALKCRFKGTTVNVLTNGTLLTEEDMENFGSIGLNALQIPLLSADPTVHDYLTELPGSWEKAVGSIKSALRILGPEHFAAVLIITARNSEGLLRTLELYRELGIRTVMVNRFNLGGNGLKNISELAMSREELHRAFRIVSDFSMKNPGMEFTSGVCTPVCVMEPHEFPGVRFTSCSTDFKSRPITISCKGEVRFCNHSPFVLGNIYERTLREILEDESIVRRYAAVPEECKGCTRFLRCKGGCRAASEQVYGTFDRIDPIIGL